MRPVRPVRPVRSMRPMRAMRWNRRIQSAALPPRRVEGSEAGIPVFDSSTTRRPRSRPFAGTWRNQHETLEEDSMAFPATTSEHSETARGINSRRLDSKITYLNGTRLAGAGTSGIICRNGLKRCRRDTIWYRNLILQKFCSSGGIGPTRLEPPLVPVTLLFAIVGNTREL